MRTIRDVHALMGLLSRYSGGDCHSWFDLLVGDDIHAWGRIATVHTPTSEYTEADFDSYEDAYEALCREIKRAKRIYGLRVPLDEDPTVCD
jgi:hypothetical protein